MTDSKRKFMIDVEEICTVESANWLPWCRRGDPQTLEPNDMEVLVGKLVQRKLGSASKRKSVRL